MIVQSRYHLPKQYCSELRERPVAWGFGELSSAVFYRTYSRDGERWADAVIRVVEGVMSIRKNHLTQVVGVRWSDRDWNALAVRLADAIFEMRMLPPGRGLWSMGTEFVYERGAHALNNCAFVSVGSSLSSAAAWLMDSLMCGVGVGFDSHRAGFPMRAPLGEPTVYQVPDSREGWVEGTRRLIASYEGGGRPIEFDYSLVRPAGSPIRGFGGVSAGPEPLRKLHERLRAFCEVAVAARHGANPRHRTRLIVDCMNAIGACVVAGNVRRSAEIAVGSIHDGEFLRLKDYARYPEREEIGWMSNNSVALSTPSEFELLPRLAEPIASNGEPGLLNLINVRKYGRSGERRPDEAIGINPCGEIPLESFELCNLVEVFPTRCGPSSAVLNETFQLATFYASTVALLRSHSRETNEVVARNRRIGVSVSGVADWIDATSVSHVFGVLNRAYEGIVRPENARLAREAGVPPSIRVTTVKPSGTVSLLAGVSAGVHWPVSGYVVRRMRVAENSDVAARLVAAGVPHEPDVVSEGTTVFEFPLRYGRGRTRGVQRVSVYEQAAVVAMLQRCWADNAVSCTLTVQQHELNQVERVLALFAPQVKSLSLMPDRPNVYAQMPLERITQTEFETRTAAMRSVKWDEVEGGGDVTPKYCDGEACEL